MTLPSQSEALQLHSRLLAGSRTATSELAVTYYEPLCREMVRRNPRIDPDLCETAAGDAILSLCKNPAAYNPAKSDLFRYLCMSAQGDLKNALQRERRHRSYQPPGHDAPVLSVVELSALDEEHLSGRAEDPAVLVERGEALREALARRHQARAAVAPALDDRDREVLRLMDEGERRTAAFAAVLDIADRPVAEQRVLVKRAKDRIKKHVERSAKRRGAGR
jgi:hypothetical protein